MIPMLLMALALSTGASTSSGTVPENAPTGSADDFADVAHALPSKRYSYETCINATKLWCRHQRGCDGRVIDQAECVGHNARQCADCVTATSLGKILGQSDPMGTCRDVLDGTDVRRLRDAKRDFRWRCR